MNAWQMERSLRTAVSGLPIEGGADAKAASRASRERVEAVVEEAEEEASVAREEGVPETALPATDSPASVTVAIPPTRLCAC